MVKIVKAIDEFSTGDSTQDKDLYFNPLIFDYAKENKLPLIDVLQVLQGREGIEVDGFYMGRLDLVNEIFDEEVTEYIDIPGIINRNEPTSEYVGVGKCRLSDEIFEILDGMDEETIKQPLDTKKLGLGRWSFRKNEGDEIKSLFSRPSVNVDYGYWIQGLIFGYAKEFEKERIFINWEILPWGDLK
tara:strand:- start:496 stop:1056 length:561 start_codon:yes stop_codon:yes gene_type:complete